MAGMMPQMNQLTMREVYFDLHCWWFELMVGCFCCFRACSEATHDWSKDSRVHLMVARESRDEEEETDGSHPIQEHTRSDLTSSCQGPLLNSKFHNPLKALQASTLW